MASCAVDDAEPGYKRVCQVHDQKDRECDDELLPSTAHEAERQCTLEYQRYYDAYNQLLADCYAPLTCEDWNRAPGNEVSGDAGTSASKGECEDEARNEFGETDACKDYCDAWLEAEDELCGRTGSETECLLANCIYDAKILANATRCTGRDDCEAYEDCLAASLE